MNSDIEFQAVIPELLHDLPLTAADKNILVEFGFLGWVAPHLYFGSFEDDEIFPELINWSWLSDWGCSKALGKYKCWLVIGSGPNGQPLLVEPNNSSVYILSASLELSILSSNFQNLYNVASAFMDMVNCAIEIDDNAFIEKRIPRDLVTKFVSTLHSYEDCLNGLSIWEKWANERTHL
ncbi:MAG: hypothetical protein ACI9O6_003351 [Glaciecola sp.]